MKHLKRFENFYLSPDVDSDEQEFLDYSKKMREVKPNDDSECETCDDDDNMDMVSNYEDDFEDNYNDDESEDHLNFEDDFENDFEDDEWGDEFDAPDFDDSGIDKFESKKSKSVSYKKSGLKNPKLADRNKNKKIEGWEKAIAKKIEAQIEKKKKK